MKTVVIVGASGFIGAHFRRQFADAGWRVCTVGGSGDAVWGNTAAITTLLEGAELLRNLAGKSVSCRYTRANKAEIIRSRTETTAELGRAVAPAPARPSTGSRPAPAPSTATPGTVRKTSSTAGKSSAGSTSTTCFVQSFSCLNTARSPVPSTSPLPRW